MNKPEIIREITKLTSLSGWQVNIVYEGMIQVIRESLARGDEIVMMGFGSLYTDRWKSHISTANKRQ